MITPQWRAGIACTLLVASVVLPAQADPGAVRFERGLLWTVEKAGVAPSHVFGTIHVSDERVATVPAKVAAALEGSRSFTMEIINDPAGAQAFAGAMMREHGPDLRALIGEDLLEQAVRHLGANGIPREVVSGMKPWGVLLNLRVPGSEGTESLDGRLLEMAFRSRKPIYQLEGVEEQISMFDDMPLETQVALLKHALVNYPRSAGIQRRLLDAYLASDLKALWDINLEYLSPNGEMETHNDYFVRRIIYGRSVVMAHRMGARLREGGALIAVGALHLYGDKGVLALLAEEGYRVTPAE